MAGRKYIVIKIKPGNIQMKPQKIHAHQMIQMRHWPDGKPDWQRDSAYEQHWKITRQMVVKIVPM